MFVSIKIVVSVIGVGIAIYRFTYCCTATVIFAVDYLWTQTLQSAKATIFFQLSGDAWQQYTIYTQR